MTEVSITRSGMVKTISYDAAEKILTLEFNSGGSYAYSEVPKEIFDGILNAESAGKYYHAHIKGKYSHEKI